MPDRKNNSYAFALPIALFTHLRFPAAQAQRTKQFLLIPDVAAVFNVMQHLDVAGIARLRDVAAFDGIADCAFRLVVVGAIVEFAGA